MVMAAGNYLPEGSLLGENHEEEANEHDDRYPAIAGEEAILGDHVALFVTLFTGTIRGSKNGQI